MLIVKAGKPHSTADELILPAAKSVVSVMIGGKAVNDLNLAALLIEIICKSQNCSLEVNGTNQILVCAVELRSSLY